MNKRNWVYRLAVLFAVLALLATACTDDDDAESTTTAASATTQAPTTTAGGGEATTTTAGGGEATTTTAAPTTTAAGAGFEGVFTTALVEDLTTNNHWAYFDPESSVHNGYVLGQSNPLLYTISVPDFLHIPVVAAGAAPDLVQEGENWVATIPLREGYMWSDGVPVTANDYVFTQNLIREFGLGGNWIPQDPDQVSDDPETDADETVKWVESVEALDDYTVKITFAPSETAPGLSIYQNGVLFTPMEPEHFWGPVAEACRAEDDPKGCLYAYDGAGAPSGGTNIFNSWEPGAFASIVANPDYYYQGVTYTVYDNLAFEQAGPNFDEVYYGDPTGEILSQYTDGPFVAEVVYSEYGSQDAAYLAFLEGEVDYVLNPNGVPSGRRDQLLAEPDLEFAVNPNEGFRYMSFNMRKAPMNDLAFRQALAYVIDKEFITQSVLAGAALPIYTVVPEANAAWWTEDVNRWGFGMSEGERLEMAVQVLKDAGYTWSTEPVAEKDADGAYTGVFIDGEGLTMPDGTLMPEIELLAPGPGYDPLRSTFATWVGQWAERLGIPMDVNPTDFNTIIDVVFAPAMLEDPLAWDIYMLGWGGGDPSLACTSHQSFFGAAGDAAITGGQNTPGYNDPEFEALSDEFDAATTIEEARAICNEMERNIQNNLPYIVLFTTPTTDAWRSNVVFPIIDVLGGINGFPNAWTGQVQLASE